MASSEAQDRNNKEIVPDQKTALQIAEVIWVRHYGQKIVEKFKPYRVELKGDYWIIVGSPQDGSTHGGGMPEIEISKLDASVTRMQLSR